MNVTNPFRYSADEVNRLRRLLPVLLLFSLLAGCASPPAAAPPGATGDAPAQAPAPAAPALPSGERLQAQPALSITTARAARVWTGRGQWFLVVAELPAGTPVQFLESREGWFHVRLDSGEVGWLSAADAAVSDQTGAGAAYQIRSGRWELRHPAGLAVEVVRVATGVVRLVLEGLGPNAQPELTREGAVALFSERPGTQPAALPVGDSGIHAVSVTEHGVLVDLEADMLHKVISAADGRLELEFRPGLAGVEKVADGWRIQIRGNMNPVLRREGSELLVDLPGALTAAEFTSPPDAVRLENVTPDAGGAAAQPALSLTTATVPSRMPAGGLRLRFPVPDQPYALYRTGPGELTLRLLSPGLAGKTIVIDPGHGGEESGAYGANGHLEKNINLGVALLLKPMLEQAGAKVIMTRTEDRRVLPAEAAAKLASHSERTQRDLAARSTLSNEAGADLFLSIHANGGVPGEGGIETFWTIPNLNASLSLRLAQLVQEEVLAAYGFPDRGVKQRPFNVIRYSQAPAVLAELGFMTHPGEERVMASSAGQQAAAEALFRAVQRYFAGF